MSHEVFKQIYLIITQEILMESHLMTHFCIVTSNYTSCDAYAWTSNSILRDTCAEISNYIY